MGLNLQGRASGSNRGPHGQWSCIHNGDLTVPHALGCMPQPTRPDSGRQPTQFELSPVAWPITFRCIACGSGYGHRDWAPMRPVIVPSAARCQQSPFQSASRVRALKIARIAALRAVVAVAVRGRPRRSATWPGCRLRNKIRTFARRALARCWRCWITVSRCYADGQISRSPADLRAGELRQLLVRWARSVSSSRSQISLTVG